MVAALFLVLGSNWCAEIQSNLCWGYRENFEFCDFSNNSWLRNNFFARYTLELAWMEFWQMELIHSVKFPE